MVIKAKQERESEMQQFKMKINVPPTWGSPPGKNCGKLKKKKNLWQVGRGIVLSNTGEREGKVNPHSLLTVDKLKVILPNPIQRGEC